MNEEMLKMMGLPGGFGAPKKDRKGKRKKEDVTLSQLSVAQIPPEPVIEKVQQNADEAKNEADLADDESKIDVIPLQSSLMKSHERAVTCLSFDPSCSRLVSGGRDGLVSLWDMGGMISTLKSWKMIEPSEGNLVRGLAWSNTGDSFLVAPSTPTPKLFDREGEEVCYFARGDMYIRDLRKVYGHTSGLTSIQWVPNRNNMFMTSSLDSTIRIWDVEQRTKCSRHFFLPGDRPGQKFGVTSASISFDGKIIACGDNSGRIICWDANGEMCKPANVINNGHVHGSTITGTKISMNKINVLTRSFDGTMKHWDLRNPVKPICIADSLPTFYEEQNCIYSPNEKYCITGIAKGKGGPSAINVYDKQTFKLAEEIPTAAPAISLTWPTKINQMFAGLSNGDVQAFYNEHSRNGVLIALGKVKKVAVEDYRLVLDGFAKSGEIEEENPYRSDDEDDFQTGWTENRNAYKPSMPFAITGPGTNGMIGINLTKHLYLLLIRMKNVLKNKIRNEDPREAILKYAEVAESIII